MTERDAPSLPAAVELHYRELTTYFTRKLGSSSLALEIVHETYIRVRRLPALQTIDNARAYLFRVATNLATDYLRREKQRDKHISTSPYAEPCTGVSARKVANAERRAWRESLDLSVKGFSCVFLFNRANLITPHQAAKKGLVWVVTVWVGDLATETCCVSDL